MISKLLKKLSVFLVLFFSSKLFADEVTMPKFVSFDKIEEACWSDNYEKFAYKTNGKVYIRNTEDLLLTKTLQDFPDNFNTSKNKNHFNAKLSDDKKSIILTTDSNNTEKTFFCSKEITCYDISEDNETLILGTTSGKIYFYDIQSKKELGSTPPPQI